MKKWILIFVCTDLLGTVNAQMVNWQNLDIAKDSLLGISTEKAYLELLKKRKSNKIIVAVIDSGVDTTHEDLKQILWVNPKEIFGNGKDDDQNGYTDDINGWDFIGGKGGDIRYDNLELTRQIRVRKSFFDSLSYSVVPPEYRTGYQAYRKMKKDYEMQFRAAHENLDGIRKFKLTLDTILNRIGKQKPGLEDFRSLQPKNDQEARVKNIVLEHLNTNPDFCQFRIKLEDALLVVTKKVDYSLNLAYDPRNIVGDDYNDLSERFYGNSDVSGPDAHHGTHVAGIIGSVRNNGIGINGIADNVRIMCIRVVPDGDERDKDVANGIRYAVDNGATIINMSFGKPYSPYKAIVDEAVKYAMSKDVLIVHAAGNEGKDLDIGENTFFPNKYYADSSGQASAWIEVGASGPRDDSTLLAVFSNYGKKTVDVFAPGVQIYSTTPGSHYESLDGTSMAAPVVAGLAALIREYYPKLSAVQVKNIIVETVLERDQLRRKCISGGVINAYSALKLAQHY